jgi:4-hydroxy-tetrahydrodipicolinate synthase
MPGTIRGIFAAAPTPIDDRLAVDVAGVPLLLDHLAAVGCHGALLGGTTGEGPCLSTAERKAVMEAAAAWRTAHPDFLLLAGTGAAALPEAIELTGHAIGLGFDGQVILPGFYFKAVSDAGIADWFLRIADACAGARILLYHIPAVAGVGVEVPVVERLLRARPGPVGGIKDSSGDLANTRALCALEGLAVFTGTDGHLPACLAAGGAGAITLRAVYDRAPDADQAALETARREFAAFPSVAAVKAILHSHAGLPLWRVRPPLEDLPGGVVAGLAARLELGVNDRGESSLAY